MAKPTPTEIRAYLEGYGVTTSIMSDALIQDFIDNEVIPFVEKYTRQSYSGVKTITEYYSGNGTGTLFLNRRGPITLIAVRMLSGEDVTAVIDIGSIEPQPIEGILKIKSALSEYFLWRVFPKGVKNLKITYTYGSEDGDMPADIKQAVKMLAAVSVLDMIEGRTGGGDLTTEGWGRSYGTMGKYTKIRQRLMQKADYILRTYSTGVVSA